jgi:sulfhydrogenase subunit beta (sulfur reductase)
MQINQGRLVAFLDSLKQAGKIIIAPRRVGDKVYFGRVDSWDQLEFNFIQSALSVKAAIFPRLETLLQYSGDAQGMNIQDAGLSDQEIVVFGLHPCDAAAFDYVGEFFGEGIADTHVQRRKAKITLVTISCKKADEACFCTSVGLGPGAVRGSDLLLTEIKDGNYYAEVLTRQGEILVETAKDAFQDSAEVDKTPYLAQVSQKFDLRPLQEKLAKCYDDPVWVKHSLPCLGCGACAFVCPTCTCFDIQDEGTVFNGVRLRCWDSCGFPIFTLHASGHNPRPVQSQRWRQRMMHKFVYSKNQNHSSSCVGCGRCLRSCPAQVSIIEQMQILSTAEVK